MPLCQQKNLCHVCNLTELFTMNKHAMYFKNLLYPVAVYYDTGLFDTMKENST